MYAEYQILWSWTLNKYLPHFRKWNKTIEWNSIEKYVIMETKNRSTTNYEWITKRMASSFFTLKQPKETEGDRQIIIITISLFFIQSNSIENHLFEEFSVGIISFSCLNIKSIRCYESFIFVIVSQRIFTFVCLIISSSHL